MTATNNGMFERLDEIGYFHLNKQISQIVPSNFRHSEIFALYAQFCLNQHKTGRHNALPS